ncbi:hypothetical protein [Glaciecola sp. MF2-115]|uniref:hypothetical protein n=1 Tax=Glaciecola sp. MF2-115 TaxID=3384827 RepID=UPI0039A0082D
MEVEIWYLLIGIALLINIAVSIFLIRRDDLEGFQKSAQILIVWLIPIFAGLGVWMLRRSQDAPTKAHKNFGGGARDSIDTGAAGGSD